MSKKSRGFQPGTQPVSPSETTSTGGAAASGDPSRAASRRRGRTAATSGGGTGLSGYRNILVAGLAVVGVGIVAVFLFTGASAAPYECDSLLTPPPATVAAQATSASPAASPSAPAAPTPQSGFPTEDLGRGHVANGSTVRYAFCPPTSGQHWSVAGRAPLRRDVYASGDDVSPGHWVHNLEHGDVVIAYRDELSDADEAGIREVFDTAAQGPVAQQCGQPNKVLAVPFKDMSEPFAMLAWDRALLLSEWDTEAALAFANEWQESPQQPEAAC